MWEELVIGSEKHKKAIDDLLDSLPESELVLPFHKVTQPLYFGPLTTRYAKEFYEHGFTHSLNMCHLSGEMDDVIYKDIPILDLQHIPEEKAIDSIRTLHEMLHSDDSKVYVHCNAGISRSPNITFLYLVSIGLDTEDAEIVTTGQSPQCYANSYRLVTEELIDTVREYGLQELKTVSRRVLSYQSK